jgi:hypothetical protein
MKTTLPLLVLAVLAITFLPAAAAHVTVTSVPPTGPIPAGQPSVITVTLSSLCPVVAAEYAQKPALELALVPDAEGREPPAYLPFVGEVVPFTVDMCDPTTLNVETTGTITVTPSAMAPAFQDIPLQPGAIGETNEGGEFTLQVAYAWSAKVVSANLTEGQNGTLVLEVTANADTILKLSSDHLHVPAEVEVASPLLTGNLTRRVEVPVMAMHGGAAQVTVSAVAKGKPATGPTTGSPVVLTATVLPALNTTEHGEHAEHDHEAATKDSPAPVGALTGVGLLALALAMRRR